MALDDHGSVTGDVAVDATTNKVHHFHLTDDSVNILEPSGCSDGDAVTMIFTSTTTRNATFGFPNYADAPFPKLGSPWKITFIKIGTTWY